MRRVIHPGRGLMLVCLLAVGVSQPVGASDEMPEVLRYARQYQAEKPAAPAAGKRPRQPAGESLSRQLARSELVRRQQQAQLQGLEKQVQTLEKQLQRAGGVVKAPEAGTGPDTRADTLMAEKAALAKQVNDLQQKAAAALQEKTEERRQQTAALATLRKQADTLAAEKAALEKTVTEAGTEKAALAKQVNDLQQKAAAALQEKTAALATLRKQADTLTAEKVALEKAVQRLQKKRPAAPLSLKTARQQQAYAAGVMYARDVREAQEGNRLLGVNLDRAVLMAGLSDALGGQPLKLDSAVLEQASQALEKAAADGYARVTKAQAAQAQAWLKTFRKEKGTAQDEAGFWYRVTYEGDGDLLQPDDTVDVVVEELLTDGTVVSDMDRAGSSLRQTVSAFPPVFAAGLQRLRNHGQITLMVPPALAYGDKGYPPDVPPGATMIYRIRVADRIAAVQDSQAKPAGRQTE